MVMLLMIVANLLRTRAASDWRSWCRSSFHHHLLCRLLKCRVDSVAVLVGPRSLSSCPSVRNLHLSCLCLCSCLHPWSRSRKQGFGCCRGESSEVPRWVLPLPWPVVSAEDVVEHWRRRWMDRCSVSAVFVRNLSVVVVLACPPEPPPGTSRFFDHQGRFRPVWRGQLVKLNRVEVQWLHLQVQARRLHPHQQGPDTRRGNRNRRWVEVVGDGGSLCRPQGYKRRSSGLAATMAAASSARAFTLDCSRVSRAIFSLESLLRIPL
jgi:hypothetical protein